MPNMCKGRQWDSSLFSDSNPSQEIPDGTITIEDEDPATKTIKGKRDKNGSSSPIDGTCDHGNPNKSKVHFKRKEGNETVHYTGFLNAGEDDISEGRYKSTGGQVDPDEGTWVATSTGGNLQGQKDKEDKEDKKDKEPRKDSAS